MIDAYYQEGASGQPQSIEIETVNEAGVLTQEAFSTLTSMNAGKQPSDNDYLVWMYVDSEYMILPLASDSRDVCCVIGLWKATYDTLGDINSCADDIKGDEPYDEMFGPWMARVLIHPKFVSYFYPPRSA
ncbi:hypothetical protein GGF42_003295 [Coemansia sp. RSA 2424]|nr:hypothetical protein GGF42_003295 [Coemansia sp. RSA 2424]